jgi:transposase
MKSGEVYSKICDNSNSESFLDFIENLLPHIPEGKKFVIILDNARPHRAKKVTEYINNVSNIELMFLPPYSPDLNPAENVWKLLRKKATHNVYFENLATLYGRVKKTLDEFSVPSKYRLSYCAVN